MTHKRVIAAGILGVALTCLAPQARLLAEFAAPFCQESLPLTIFNGWQWEYRYSLAQFETFYYDLRHQTSGSVQSQWLQMEPSGNVQKDNTGPSPQSQINVSFR